MAERLALCLRNLGRHGWRTRIILFIAFFGALLTFVFENLIEDIAAKQSDMFARGTAGHFRIVHRDVETRNSFGYYYCEPADMLDPAQIGSLKAFLAAQPEVSGCEERIIFFGVLYGENDEENGFAAMAMDLGAYNRNFTDLFYARGLPVGRGQQDACAASWYEYEESKTVKVGSSYVMLLPSPDGGYLDRLVTVQGGIDFRSLPRENMGFGGLYFDLQAFRTMAGYGEASATEVIGFLKDARDEKRVLERTRRFLAAEHPELQVVSWRYYAPIFGEIVVGFSAALRFVEAVLLAICVLLVVKLTSFAVLERYGEIGTMRAIGFGRADIVLQFTLEGFLAIAAGVAAGFAVGAALIAVLHQTGVPNSSTFFKYVIGNGFHPSFHPSRILRAGAVFLTVAVLAPLLPALAGGRLPIVRALERR
jgi:putative ABC transport system permease protein